MESEEEDDEVWNKSVDDLSDCRGTKKPLPLKISKSKDGIPFQHSRIILHIDIDCFYAQVEMIRNPTLRNKPLGIQQKNIVVTCNYPARARGVTKLMYIKDAKAKCPELVLVSGEDLTKYREMSYKISELLQTFCPLVERLGFDENFLDITQLVADRLTSAGRHAQLEVKGHLYKADTASAPCSCGCRDSLTVGSQIAAEIRASIRQELGITCCGGVAHNKLLSKLVAGTHKPDQQTTLYPEHVLDLMGKLASVRNIPGIGSSTARRMKEMGIVSIQDLHTADSSLLEGEFGAATADTIKKLGHGVDESPVVAFGLPQTLSVEDSFKKCCTLDDVRLRVHQLFTHLLERLLKDGRTAHTLRLTIRNRIKGYIRESRQCSIQQSLLAKLSADTLPKVCSQMESLAVGLFTKMIDPKQPFHLTLINVAFAKLEQKSGSGCISKFLQKSSNNQSNIPHSKAGEYKQSGLISESKTVTPNFQSHQQTRLSTEIKTGSQIHTVVNQSEFSTCITNATSPTSNSTTPQREVDNSTITQRTATEEQNKAGLFKWFSKSPDKQTKLKETRSDNAKGMEHSQSYLVSSQTACALEHKQNVTSKGDGERKGTSFFQSFRRKATNTLSEESHNKRQRLTDRNSNSVSEGDIPADIDRAVFDELPADIQQEILANAASATRVSSSPVGGTQKSNTSRQGETEQFYTNRQRKESGVFKGKDVFSTGPKDSCSSLETQVPGHPVEETLTNPMKDELDCVIEEKRSVYIHSYEGKRSNDTTTCGVEPSIQSSEMADKVDTTIPTGIDKSVFLSLPKEIQKDLLNEWKSKSPTANSERQSNRTQKPASIMSYFHKSDKS